MRHCLNNVSLSVRSTQLSTSNMQMLCSCAIADSSRSHSSSTIALIARYRARSFKLSPRIVDIMEDCSSNEAGCDEPAELCMDAAEDSDDIDTIECGWSEALIWLYVPLFICCMELLGGWLFVPTCVYNVSMLIVHQ